MPLNIIWNNFVSMLCHLSSFLSFYNVVGAWSNSIPYNLSMQAIHFYFSLLPVSCENCYYILFLVVRNRPVKPWNVLKGLFFVLLTTHFKWCKVDCVMDWMPQAQAIVMLCGVSCVVVIFHMSIFPAMTKKKLLWRQNGHTNHNMLCCALSDLKGIKKKDVLQCVSSLCNRMSPSWAR